MAMGYEFAHSIECPVSRDFAWRFWSAVENWAAVDPAVEWVSLDGPFASGTRGVTKLHGLGPMEWRLSVVQDGRSATIEIMVDGAVVKFCWRFEEQASGGVRITQRVSLEGERAGEYLEGMRELEQGIPAGMHSLAVGMVRAAEGAA